MSRARDPEEPAMHGRALRGGLVLGARQAVAHGFNLAGVVALARLLSPDEFGAVAIAVFAWGLLSSAISLGLGASLIQRAEEPSTRDGRIAVAAQSATALLLAFAVWPLAPWIARADALPPGGATLLRAVVAASLLLPLQLVPLARLERHLRFGRLAAVEVLQAAVFNAVAVGLAWSGLGLAGVASAFVARAVAGAFLAGMVSPGHLGFAWSWERLRPLLRFGLPFQGAVLVSVAKDGLTPVLIGLVAGSAAVGYVTWAQTLATFPTLALMILQRVWVPAFARLQASRDDLAVLVERALLAAHAIAAPVAVITLALLDPIVALGFGEKWRSAEELFYWLWCANLVVPTVTPLIALLNALGRSRTVLGFATLWMAGTWAIGAPLVLWLGPIGYGIANLIVQGSAFWVTRRARREVAFRVLPVVAPVWACAAVAGLAALVAAHIHPPGDLLELGGIATGALVVDALALAAAMPREARRTWEALRAGVPAWARGSR